MQKLTFSELTQGKPNFPRQEEEIVQYWRDIKAFETQLEKTKDQKPFTFYDGPPFATGTPHYGHILAGTIKDVICRYASMTGHYVERRFGWDCHGLPVEYEIEKKLNIQTREDVMKLGIKKYNEECRSIVMRCANDWEITVERMGRWIDFKNDYKTMNKSFMESAWWVFSELHRKKLVYRDFKVMPYSTALNTPLSNFEAKSNYQTRRDPAIVVSFPVIGDEHNASFLAWTTTPWTLPSNLALCVNANLTYVKFQDNEGKYYICGKKVLQKPKKDNTISKGRKGFKSKVIAEYKGSELVGKTYKPLFEYFGDRKHCFRVIADNYVTEEEGTGIVHQAPGFGEDDLRACENADIHKRGEEDIVCPVDHNGRFTDEVKDYAGQYVLDANPKIIKDLRGNGRLWNEANFDHEYPMCWRSDTPLLYKAIPSWFIRVTAIKEQLVANNQKTYWVPSYVKDKRFHNWLVDARDWAVSRNRYWGTPIPIWISEDEKEWEVIGSVEELEKRSGQKIDDLHRENIDDIKIKSLKTGKTLHRVDEVFDCWFESGSMPYGQCHFPFAYKGKEEEFFKRFPANFIAEGLDQTRGWFYTLLVLSTALFDKPAWQNLIVNGMVLAEDGSKMSKRKKNYPAPEKIFNEYGADALRIYLCQSPVVRAEKLQFSEKDVKATVTKVLSPWYNAYNFLIENVSRYERTTGKQFRYNPDAHKQMSNIMDKWILSELQSLVKFFRQEMEAYRLYTINDTLINFIELLCNTYVRMNRPRIRGQASLEDTVNSTQALYHVLLTLCQLMAPFSPFIVETMYLNLRGALGETAEKSVHFMSIPQPNEDAIDKDIERRVQNLLKAIIVGRAVRDDNKFKNKLPLNEMMVVHPDSQFLKDVEGLKEYVLRELNVKTVTFSDEMADYIQLSAEPVHKALGSKYKGKARQIKAEIVKLNHEQLTQLQDSGALTVCDEKIVPEDVVISWNFKGDTKKWVHKEDKGCIVLLDQRITKELRDECTAREVSTRIQQMRKNGKLVPADVVNAFYNVENEEKDELSSVFERFGGLIEKRTRIKVMPLSLKSPFIGTIITEDMEIDGKKVTLSLCIPQIFLNKNSSTISALDATELSLVEEYLQQQDVLTLMERYPNKSTFKFSIDEKQYQLQVGADFVFDAANLKEEVVDID
eukprot:CAMPEP_0197024830 /NCGR_PEP_ID=MMETSP1384-20130603/5313_1 /TAXON_ID=29189 /ORGANISM="Ammonia sp." /LENGTH=1156 /DNA_ID=CAMNT_0042453285 /DNA_START=146 /DNA_END=3616 /DNA_ORIENTATION=-